MKSISAHSWLSYHESIDNISNYTGRAVLKKYGHSIYTNKFKYYANTASQLLQMTDDELYVEYDENNNLIRDDFAYDSEGKLLVYVKPGGKLNNKPLPGSGWCYINVLDYI